MNKVNITEKDGIITVEHIKDEDKPNKNLPLSHILRRALRSAMKEEIRVVRDANKTTKLGE